jgi:Ni/Fe-hydrogenase 1 B-type cytochrome subunit
MSELKSYRVWDTPTRWFHWINAICILALVVGGLLIINTGALGASTDGKVMLKTTHTWIGYVFVINLLWRIVWAFLGNRHARWRAFLPWGRVYGTALRKHLASVVGGGHPETYLGHNPLARLSITTMLLLSVILAVTGLLLAGTDLFMPPVGHWIAQRVAAAGVDPGTLVPYAPEMVDRAAFDQLRAFRKPFAVTHLYSFYILSVIAVLHVAGAILAEVREGGNAISATFTGTKILSRRPVDKDRGD